MSGAILEIENLETHYGKIHALRGISFSVKAGEIVTLLGANGAGKSTTLRTISGLIRSTSGAIRFKGEDITRKPAHDIVKMGLIHVPEGRKIFKGMTILENLELGSFTLDDEEERRKRLEHVFEIFPVLEERKHRDSAFLSGGEQQMLAIGRGLMSEPTLLLLDEPSLGLAPLIISQIFEILDQIRAEGMTIFLVEQNAHRALQLADRGYVLENGRIVLADTGDALLQNQAVRQAYLGG